MKVVLYGSPVISFGDLLQKRLSNGYELTAVDYDASDQDIEAAFAGAQAVITVRFDKRIPCVPSLTLVQVPGVGCDEIDTSLLPSTATLCNVYGHGDAVAEYVLLGMLQWCHQFYEADASFRSGGWERSSRFQAPPHRELSGSVVGIVGYGLIGQAVATHLQGFNVTTLVCNRSKPAQDALHSQSYSLSELGEMVTKCDFLVVSVALSGETTDLIDKNLLVAMKSDAVLVNVARGPVINEDALFAALKDGEIGGAVLDVWYNYPSNTKDQFARPSSHDFAKLKNVYMTPHISGWTDGTVKRRWDTIADNLTRLGKGEALLNVVNSARSQP